MLEYVIDVLKNNCIRDPLLRSMIGQYRKWVGDDQRGCDHSPQQEYYSHNQNFEELYALIQLIQQKEMSVSSIIAYRYGAKLEDDTFCKFREMTFPIIVVGRSIDPHIEEPDRFMNKLNFFLLSGGNMIKKSS